MRTVAYSPAMTALSLCLVACGGGGGSAERPALAPPPVASPSPTPTPTPAVSGQSPFGVSADTAFATVGDDVEFRWLESAKAYEVRFPGKQWERLTGVDSTATHHNYYPQSGLYGLSLSKGLDYRYTNLVLQFENGWGYPIGRFAYGIPTASGDVPLTGSATYEATAAGRAGDQAESWAYNVRGTAELRFDFGAGTLAGHFDPLIDNWTNDARALGRYSFVNTVFGAGSTNFSGELSHGSLTELGSFSGIFTGPQATELMAEWRAPYNNPWTQQPGIIGGVWIGKRP